MSPFGSVGGKLAVALVLIVAGALAIVYLIVVPSYRQSVVNARLDAQERALRSLLATNPPAADFLLQAWVQETAAPALDARVVVFDSFGVDRPVFTPFADSNTGSSQDVQDDEIAVRAAERRTIARGTVTRGGREFAEVAYPFDVDSPPPSVVLVSSPLTDELQTVAVVRHRVFIAGALAIVFALVLGYLLAGAFSRRIRRLEAAAERIAAGDFDEPVVDAGTDEIGQLARAFERMRQRLAHLDRARGEFIANASHELRTPLFSLAGFLELLDDEELDAATRQEFMEEIREQVGRLTKLASELLDLSRMDAGRLGIAEESLDLAQMADEVANEFGPRAGTSGHNLEVAADRPVVARGDEERVLQIGRILVENALVHTPQGTTVRVSASIDGSRATLTVADDGPGIPREAQNQVFERFYRLDGTVASGSGLGLAIARELAELMGGRIELDSQNGWTLFTLVLSADAGDREPEPLFA
ncbi:MAG TPA: HAMP domain-containing sensor histidine kinase [Gaiellaceae bacterium]|jgi:signal transduction histidine kinase